MLISVVSKRYFYTNTHKFLSQDLDGDSSVTYAFLEHSVMPNNANATILFILVLMETPEQEFISHKPPLLRRYIG
jgi:hypothetical protein